MEDNERTKIRVIVCRPDERAEVVEIEDKLEAMQELVGGMIQEYMPFEDEVALIVNEEGKLTGLPLNRGIHSEDGRMQDIIAGDFFICYAPLESERFLSMPPELEKKYKDMFDLPEMFMMGDDEIHAFKYDPNGKDNPRTVVTAEKKRAWEYER